MNKHDYIEKSFATIRAKNLEVPFNIAPGVVVTDLEHYLRSLKTSYLASKSPIENLFVEKIEHLKKL